ncbi:MAG: hypothetical protein O2967_02540 [Proteobacteria bacterium]|nr:hypothetical protein [Pseudomonadota bacterium]
MSVGYQDDLDKNWNISAAMPETAAPADGIKYATLNAALDQAGSVLGDMRGNLPIAFRFKWHDMVIFCQIVERDSEVVLDLATDLGPLPFTIENSARRGYLKELGGSKTNLPIGEFVLTERRRFRHCVTQTMSTPITGSHIVTTVVQSLLTARPYYELAKARL